MSTRRRAVSILAGLVAVAAGLSCSDRATGPQLPVRVLLAPVMPHIPNLSAALGITNFRVIIGNPPKVDTSYAFGPTTDSIVVNLSVPNSKKGDALPATIQGRAGTTVLFSGTVTVTAQDAGSPGVPQSTPITIKYVGAGANAASITMNPRDTSVLFGDSLTYKVSGLDSLDNTLPAIPSVISTSDTSVRVRVNRQPNVVVVPQRRGFAWIVATTATGIIDSTRLFFTPVPVVIAKLAGDGQSGVVGTALAGPLTVQVKAADSSGVPSLPITFSSLSGGSVQTATVLTDTNGIASVPATLGPITGAQQFQAVAPKLPPVTFSATALPGTPKNITIQTGNAQTGAVGAVLPVAPAVIIKDSLGNVVPGVKVYFTKVSSSTSRPVNDSSVSTIAGVATSGGWRMGATPRVDSLVATTSVGSVTFTATATVAPAFKVIAASGDGQTAIEGTALAAPLVAKVVDSLNNGVSGVTVNFATASGTLAPASGATNAAGTVSSTWTLPLGPGAKTATASVAAPVGVTPFTFSATALPVTPTLFVSVLGSNVVGVLRQGTLVIRTSAPVPVGAGPLVIAVTSSAPNTLALGASTAQIIPGDSIATISVTGGSTAGSSTVTASAQGYISGVLNVPVSLNAISSSLTFNVGLGQTANLPITLSQNSSGGAIPVAVNSSAPGTVFVTTPTVSIPATTGSASLRGDALGSATVALTNPNYSPFTVNVNVTATLLWRPQTQQVYTGGIPAPLDTIQLTSGGLPIAAPAGGVAVTLTSLNPACVPSGSGTIPAGSPNLVVPITYGGTAPLPCSTSLIASASAGVTLDTLAVTVNAKPSITGFNTLTVGRGLQTSAFVAGVPVAQHGGVTVTVQVADSTKVRLALTDTAVGSGIIQVPLQNGGQFFSYWVNAFEGKTAANDSVMVTANAPGFNPDTFYIQLRNIAVRLDNMPTTSTTLSARTILNATVGYLATPAATAITAQTVRPGGTTKVVSFRSTSPLVARLRGGGTGADTTTLVDSLVALVRPGTIQSTNSVPQGAVLLQPVGAGTDSVFLSAADTNLVIVPVLTRAGVVISAPKLNPSTFTVGRGLQLAQFYQPLSVPAPAGGVTLSVWNPVAGTPVKVSTNDSTLTDSTTFNILQGNSTLTLFVHALEGFGPDTAYTLRVHAPGYVDTTITVNLRSSSFRLVNLPTTTTSIAPRSFFNVQVGYRATQASPTINSIQNLRAGAPPLAVTIVNDSALVGNLLTAADSVTGSDTVTVSLLARTNTTPSNLAQGGVAFLPTAGGVATLTGTVPQGSTFTPGNFARDTITVTAPTTTAIANNLIVGRGLQTNTFNNLLGTVAPAGGVDVTITSLDSTKIKLGLNQTTLSGQLVINVPAGSNGGTSLFVHALEGTGPNDTVLVQVAAPGYTTTTARIFRRTAAVQLINMPTTGFTTLTAPRLIQARVGYLNLPTDTTMNTIQALRALAPPVTVNVSAVQGFQGVAKLLSQADSATGLDNISVQLVAGQNATPGSLALGGFSLRPVTSGTYRVTKTASSAAQTFVPVNSPNDSAVIVSAQIGNAGTLTVGAGLQEQMSFVSLSAPAPAGGIKVTIRSSDGTKVKVSPNATTAGVDSLDVTVGAGASGFGYYVQGMENGLGTTTVLLSAPGYTGSSQTVNVVQPGVILSGGFNFATFQRSGVTAFVGTPTGNTVNAQAVRAGAPGPLSLTITSGNPSVVGLLSQADTSAGSATATIQIPSGQFGTTTSTTSPQYFQLIGLATGSSTISASIPGYVSTPLATQTAIVTTPNINSFGVATVGAGLQLSRSHGLGTQFHGGRTVTITSADPTKLLLAPNDSTPGAASITVNVADRQTTIPYYTQGVEGQVGRVNVTLSAPGFTSLVVSDSVAQPAVEISSFTASSAVGTDRVFTVRVGVPNSPTAPTGFSQIQAVRWNAATPTPLTVNAVLTPSAVGVATLVNQGGTGLNLNVAIAPKQTQSATSVATGGIAWRPLASGTATIAVTSTGFLAIPTTSTRTVTVP